jgi:hypothetical protein
MNSAGVCFGDDKKSFQCERKYTGPFDMLRAGSSLCSDDKTTLCCQRAGDSFSKNLTSMSSAGRRDPQRRSCGMPEGIP